MAGGMAGIPQEWKLSPSQRLEIFNTKIAPQEILPHINHQKSNDSTTAGSKETKPLAIIIVGQTGAGKTRLAPDLLQAMVTSLNLGSTPSTSTPTPLQQQKQEQEQEPKQGQTQPEGQQEEQKRPLRARLEVKGIAHLIADTYKTYHPFYSACLISSPEKASLLASDDARTWLSLACSLASSHNLPVLLESACRHPDDFVHLAKIFHQANYKVSVAILAVPYPLSRLGILVRYYRDLPEAKSRGLPLRLTPRKVHDDSYKGLETAAGFVDMGGCVDGVVVVRRNGGLAYKRYNVRRKVGGGLRENSDNRSNGGENILQQSALGALMIERERALSFEESETARRDIEELTRRKDPKVDEQVGEIEGLIEKLGEGSQTKEDASLPTFFRDLGMFDASEFVGVRLEEEEEEEEHEEDTP